MDGMTYRTSAAMFLFYLFGGNGHFHCFLTEFKELDYLRMLKLFEYDCRKVFSASQPVLAVVARSVLQGGPEFFLSAVASAHRELSE